jgi:hypothetical protein
MEEGMNKINRGFMYNSKSDVKDGLSVVEGANAIFKTVDVKHFLNSKKEQVAKNININLHNHLKALRKSVDADNYTQAASQYSKIMGDCMSCHNIIRGW